MISDTICLAGNGWGAIAAYNSLKKCFNNIGLLSNDNELLHLARASDVILNNMMDAVSPIIICAGYKKIIGSEILDHKEIINIHYSLLPKFRGFHSTVWAILNDEKKLGLTIHQMNQFIDDGPIIYQYGIENDGVSTATWYMEQFNSWISDNLSKIIQDYQSGFILLKPQNKDQATWVGKRTLEDCKIDFSRDHDYLQRFFRALTPPYPRPFFRIKNDKKIFFAEKVSFIKRDIDTHIGRILNIDNDGIYVSSTGGYVIIMKITDNEGNDIDFKEIKVGSYLDQKFND